MTGAHGRPSALFFFVLPFLLIVAAIVVRSTRGVDGAPGVITRLTPHLPAALEAAESEGVPLPLLLAVASAESSGRSAVRSPKGAVGLLQLLPGTAQDMARKGHEPAPDLTDPATSLRLGARYLAIQIRKYADRPAGRELALCAYNAGPRRVDGWLRDRGGPDPTPRGIQEWVPFAETRTYVRRVTAWEARWRTALASSAKHE